MVHKCNVPHRQWGRQPGNSGNQGKVEMKHVIAWSSGVLLLVAAVASQAGSLDLNGFRFDQSEANILLDEIHSGGPPRGGIPAIDQPRFMQGGERDEYPAESRVLRLAERGIAKAYPIDIMN